jgi:hypothetical protein
MAKITTIFEGCDLSETCHVDCLISMIITKCKKETYWSFREHNKLPFDIVPEELELVYD